MPFVAPLALAGLVFVPVVVAFYLLRLRRDETVVSSTLLWQRLVEDVEANAPWQRLRRSLLLLLQLLLVVALAILAARPFLDRPAELARDLVVVVDVSASMGATDVAPDRLSAAKDKVLAALGDVPAGGRVSVIAAGRTARVVANGTTDLARVRAAVSGLRVETAAGDLGDALRLASALAARSGDGQVVVATDAALAAPPAVHVESPVTVLQVGRERRNQAIAALAVRPAPSGVTRSVFVSVTNADLSPAKVRLEVSGDGRLLEARDLFLDPVARADVSVDDVPRDVAVVEVHLSGVEPAGPDELAADDRAWAVVAPERLHRILLVSAGDPYLETALVRLPDAELYEVKPADYGTTTHPEKFDLVVFEDELPAELPKVATLAIAPPRSSPLGEVTGTLTGPGVGTLDPGEPLLRYVDLSTLHVAEARRLALPAWARAVIPGPAGAPLLYAGKRDGIPTAVLAFEPRRSDLPLQVAFPILLANLAGELLGASATPSDALAPGSPIELSLPTGASGLRVTRPDGSTVDLRSPSGSATSVLFSGTQQLGVYSAVATGVVASAAPTSGTPSASSSAGASASPLSSGPVSSTDSPGPASASGPAAAPLVDPSAPERFAVDLFDAAESNIAPGDAARIAALGTGAAPGGSAVPGARASPLAGAASAAARPPAHDELWTPLLLGIVLLLLVEWAVYERDGLLRLRRALTGRLPLRLRLPRRAGRHRPRTA